MGTTAEKLQNIIDAKSSISAAIEAKGGTVPTELTGYGAAIQALPSGGGGGGSSEFTNKLIDRSLTEVTAADLSGVTKIGRRSFAYCSDLTSLVIPDNVTEIDSEILTYANTTNQFYIPLSVEIGNGVSAIGDKAFSYVGYKTIAVPALKIYFKPDRQTIPTIGSDLFKSTGQFSGMIRVPAALLDDWKAAWSSVINPIAISAIEE